MASLSGNVTDGWPIEKHHFDEDASALLAPDAPMDELADDVLADIVRATAFNGGDQNSAARPLRLQ